MSGTLFFIFASCEPLRNEIFLWRETVLRVNGMKWNLMKISFAVKFLQFLEKNCIFCDSHLSCFEDFSLLDILINLSEPLKTTVPHLRESVKKLHQSVGCECGPWEPISWVWGWGAQVSSISHFWTQILKTFWKIYPNDSIWCISAFLMRSCQLRYFSFFGQGNFTIGLKVEVNPIFW